MIAESRTHRDDVASLAPLGVFFHSVRRWLWLGISCLILMGLMLTAALWWTAPGTPYGTLGLSISFPGAQEGLYPNNLPFSPEDLLAQSVLRQVFEKNRLQDFSSFEDFLSALSIRQDGEALERLQGDYEKRLEDKRVLGPERLRLQEEFQSRLRTARSTEYQLVWLQHGRTVPLELQAKVLEDIPRLWAEEVTRVKRVLEFAVPLPNPRAVFDLEYASANPFGAFDQLAERAGALGLGIGGIANLPGASRAALPDGTSLIDLQIRHRAFTEQDLEAFQNRILFQQGSVAEAALIQDALTFQIRSREEELEQAQRRVDLLSRSLQDYLMGRRLKSSPAENQPGKPDSAGQSSESATLEDSALAAIPFLGRLEEVATLQQEQAYRRDFIDRITRAREDASMKQARLEESRRNIFLVKKAAAPLARPAPASSAGSMTDPGSVPLPAATAFPPMDMNDFAAIWGQLNDLIGQSINLVGIISRNYLGDNVSLYQISSPFAAGVVPGVSFRILALALVAWVLLGLAGLLGVLWAYYRYGVLRKDIGRPSSP